MAVVRSGWESEDKLKEKGEGKEEEEEDQKRRRKRRTDRWRRADRWGGEAGGEGGPECSFRGEPTQTRIRVVHRTPKTFQEIAPYLLHQDNIEWNLFLRVASRPGRAKVENVFLKKIGKCQPKTPSPRRYSPANSGRNFCWKYTQRGDLSSTIGRERCEASFGLQVFAYP